MLTKAQKVKHLRELMEYSTFEAQLQLEQELLQDYSKKLLELNVKDSHFWAEYAKLQGAVEALRALQGVRKTITSDNLRERVEQ